MTIKQQLVFFTAVNKAIKNPHLSLYIRDLLKGQDLQFKQYLSGVSGVDEPEETVYKLLYTFCVLNNFKSKHLVNTLDGVHLSVNEEKWNDLKEKLQETLKKLKLPTIDS